MSLNLAQGFLRTWIALSGLWVIAVFYHAYMDTGIPSLTKSCATLLEFQLDSTGEHLGQDAVAKCESAWQSERLSLFGLIVGPPATLLALGLLTGWVVNGFKSSRRGSK